MKILFVTPCYYPAIAFGGTTSAITQICSALQESGASVDVFTTNSNGNLGYLNVSINTPVVVDAVEVTYFPCNIGNERALYSSDLVARLKDRVKKYDLVYISAIWQYIGVSAAKICRNNLVPYIYGTHGSFSEKLMKKKVSIKKIYFELFLKPALRNARALHITAQQELADAKANWLVNDSLITIPNIINPELYKRVESNTFRERYNIPETAKLIITVSRPDWMKRVDLLIKSITDHPNYYLVYAGQDRHPIAKEWKDLAKSKGLSDRFICTGLLDRAALLEAYSASDVFCLISENENFGMVAAEALLCEVPIIVSKQAAITEYLNNSEIVRIVDIDVLEIQLALQTIFAQPNINTLACRELAIEKFAPQVVGKVFYREFEKLLQHESS